MKIRTILLILFAITFSNSNAQKFELGKVSIAELQEKVHPKDSSAAATILFRIGEVRFDYIDGIGFEMVTEVKTKIKIYKKEGYDWANKTIEYYSENNSNEKVYFSDVVTYNLVGGKIEKTKIKSDGQFDEKVNKYWSRKKITMPNVKEGSIIEYEYTIKSPRFSAMRDWYFQSSIPVNYSKLTTYMPEYFYYRPNSKGYIFPKTTVEKNNKSITFANKERHEGPMQTTSSSFSYDKVDYIETKTTYIAENLPAMKDEAYVNNIDNYTASISHELSMVKFPNSPSKSYSTDWESVTKTIYEDSDFGAELNKTGYFEDDIKALTKDLKTREETIGAIFNFVKTNVKWNDYQGYSCNDGVKKAYKDKTGNVAEINLMLTAMLRFAGFNANPVLVSTRSNGIAMFPSHSAFNHVIAAIEIDGAQILLDATDKYAMPNVLPIEDLNWFGRLIRKDGTSDQVDLNPKTLTREMVLLNLTLDPSGTLEGTAKIQMTDYKAMRYRHEVNGVSQDNYLEEFENSNNNIEIIEYVRENEKDLSKPISESFSFKSTKDVEIINDKIYISPMSFLASKENLFKQEVREYPVDFGYPFQNRYNVLIEIPEGYVVESMPTSINIATGEDIGSYKYVISNANNKIQIATTKTINAAIVPSDFYPVLKGFYQQMIDKQNEKIVLKKI